MAEFDTGPNTQFDIAPLATDTAGATLAQPEDANAINLASDLPGEPVQTEHDQQAVAQRAGKYDFALGYKSPGAETIQDRINSNLEDADRQRYSLEKTLELHDLRNQMVRNMSDQAASEGRNLTMAETQTIQNLSAVDLAPLSIGAAADQVPGTDVVMPEQTRRGTLYQDPNTFFERQYAKKVIATALQTGEDTPYANSLTEDPEGTHTKLDVFEDLSTFKESYQKIAEEVDAIAGKQSTAGYLMDAGKGLVPFYTWYKDHNLLAGTQGGPFLPGDNMADQVREAYSGRPEEKIPQVRATVLALAKDNPQLAQQYAHNLVDYPSSARLLDNIIGPTLDIATVAPVGLLSKAGKGIAAAGMEALEKPVIQSAELKAANAYKAFDLGKATTATADIMKNAASNPKATFNKILSDLGNTVLKKNTTVPEVLDSVGQVNPSAATSVLDKIQNQYTSGAAASTGWRELINEIPGFMNPSEILDGVRSTWSTAKTSRLMEDLVSDRDTGLTKIMLDVLKTNKVGPEALQAATDAAARTFRIERRDLENSIMNVFENNIGESLGDHQALIHLGNPDAVPFSTKQLAESWAKLYGVEESSKAVPVGTSWGIQLQRPMDFTLPSVRDAMKVDALNAPSPWANVLGRVLTKIRSGEYVMPRDVLVRMKQATYGSSGLEQMIMKRAKLIGKLRDNKNFLSYLKSEQMEKNPLNPDKLGLFAKNQGEFEVKWNQRFNSLPSEAETRAYWAYRNINVLHYAALNLGLYLDKSAAGLTDLIFSALPGRIEGKITTLDAFNRLSKDVNPKMLVLEDGQEPRIVYGKYNTPIEGQELKSLDYIKEMLNKRGYILSQISDTGDDALRALTAEGAPLEHLAADKGRFNFVISKDVKAQPLSMRQVPFQMGGHNIAPDGHYISQAKMSFNKADKTATYFGDRNLFFVGNEKLSKEVAGHFEQFRQLYKELKSMKRTDPRRPLQINLVKQYAKDHLPLSFKQVAKDFDKGVMDIDSPILSRVSNQNLDSAYKLSDRFQDYRYIKHSDSELNLYRGHVNLEFATERGLPMREVVNRGDSIAPNYGLKPADLLDPMAALDRGVNAMVRGRYFEPMKLEIANRFVSEFGDLLNGQSRDIALDPFKAMQRGDWKQNLQGSDLERLRQAQAYQARANQFFGTAVDPAQKFYNYLGMKIIGGDNPEAMGSFRQSLASILLEKNPAEVLKKLAYFPKMGMWNFKQLLQQGNTIANVIALSPKHGLKSGVFSMVHNFVLRDAEHLTEEGAKIVQRLGFDPEEFLKVTKALDRTGFGKMGREVASREQHLNAKVVQTKLGAMLDYGLYFMRQGEEFVRRAAFNAAYMEKLAEKGGKELTDNDLALVLDRADFMNVNMSHASNAAWQQGLTSIPTQFWSYQVRLFEQLAGKRMTAAEKGRLLGTYSMLYGIPIAATTAMPFWPVHESIKEYLISHNIPTDDNVIVKTLNDGMISGLIELLGGENTNVESVYGPSGIPFLKDLYDGKKSVTEAMTGASGNVLFNTLASIAPAISWIGQSVIGNERVPLKAQDFADVLSNVSSFSALEKMYVGVTTHSYLTKYGQQIASDDSVGRIIFNSLLGINPQAIDDMYRTMQVNQDYQDYHKKLHKWIQEDIRNGLMATSDADKEDWFKRARVKSTWLDDPVEMGKVWLNALTDNQDMIEKSRMTHARQSEDAALYEADRAMNNGAQ